ncbi:MAG: hypothetical protein CMB77_06340 [Euryarchaeota archaeon]|nr:hypothetical protein [Euryarchaeota archaeon]
MADDEQEESDAGNDDSEVTSDQIVDGIIDYIKKVDKSVAEVFKVIDLNSDKRISGPELQTWLKEVGIADLAPPDVMMTLGLIDENKDGYISLSELRSAVGEKASALGLLLEAVEDIVDSAVEGAKELVEDAKRVWDTEQSLLAAAFPNLPWLADKRVNRGIIVFSLVGGLLYLYNAFIGLARTAPGAPRDHSLDLTAMLIPGYDYGGHNSALAPHFDPLSFLVFVGLGALLFFAQYSTPPMDGGGATAPPAAASEDTSEEE